MIIGKLQKTKEFLCEPAAAAVLFPDLNINIRDLSDNRKFWKTNKSYFTNKGLIFK